MNLSSTMINVLIHNLNISHFNGFIFVILFGFLVISNPISFLTSQNDWR